MDAGQDEIVPSAPRFDGHTSKTHFSFFNSHFNFFSSLLPRILYRRVNTSPNAR